MRKLFYPLITLLFVSLNVVHAQVMDIATAKSKTPGTTVTIKGIVTNGAELGVIRYIQDETAGAAIYSSSMSSVQAGDSIEVTGAFTDYNGLLEMSPVNSFNVISQNNDLPEPITLSAANAFAEKYEGMLVRVQGVHFGQSGMFAGNTNYKIQQGAVQKEVRITNGTELIGTPIPASGVDITGIMSQYKTTYQLLLRYLSDIEQAGPVLSSGLVQTQIKTNSFRLSFTTKKDGNTIIKYGLTKSLELGTLTDTAKRLLHSALLSGLMPATFYYAKAYSVDANQDTAESQIGYFSTASLSSGKVTVYFNHSVDTTVKMYKSPYYLNKTIDDSLVSFINGAKQSLDIAIYSFDNNNLSANISNALNAAYTRGVRVRIVADGSLKNSGITQLNGNIPVIKSPQGASYTIMHNKFVIRDVSSSDPNVPTVWAGSTNWTDNQIHDDANSVVIVQDEALAKAYLLEFEEMFGSSGNTPNASAARFGQFKTDNTPHRFNIGGRMTELFFSPSDGTTNAILRCINSADKEIYFSQLAFTRNDLAYAIRNKAMDSVFAAGVVNDTSQAGFTFNIMKPVLGNRLLIYKGSNIYHHKYLIVDQAFPESDPLVLVGSHNWSNAAETKNDENTLIFHDDTLANMYYQEWLMRYRENGGTDTFKRDTTGMHDTTGSGIRPYGRHQNVQLQYCYWANDALVMSFESQAPENMEIALYDLNGKYMAGSRINLSQGEAQGRLQTGALRQGLYILYVKGASGTSAYKMMKW